MLFVVMKKVLQGAFLPFVILPQACFYSGAIRHKTMLPNKKKTEITEQASDQNIEQQAAEIAQQSRT